MTLLFWDFINKTAYHLVKYEPLSPSTKELHMSILRSRMMTVASKVAKIGS